MKIVINFVNIFLKILQNFCNYPPQQRIKEGNEFECPHPPVNYSGEKPLFSCIEARTFSSQRAADILVSLWPKRQR